MTYLENITAIIENDQLPVAERALLKITKPRFELLAGASGPGNDMLQKRMQRFMIVIAKDQAMREPLAKKAALRLGLDGEPDLDAASFSELETIFSVGVQDIGQPFFELLLQEANDSDDSAFRGEALGALARVEDPLLVEQLQAAVLRGDFKGTEMLGVVFRQMVRAKTTELTYAWIKENADAVIDLVPETFRSRTVPGFGGSFCSADRADEWRDFIEAHADSLPGYQRSLAQTIEGIRLCAALREANADELVEAFAAY